jgi:hypothetical protein
MQYYGTGRHGTHQSVAYTGTAGTIAVAITTGVQKVRIVTTSAAYVKCGKAVTATTSDVYWPADSVEHVTISAGEVVSAVQVSSGGTLHVTQVE